MKTFVRLLAATLFLAASLSATADLSSKNALGASCEAAGLDAGAQPAKSERIQLAQMSCRECQVRRDRCHAGCTGTLQEQARCVNRCNANYPCVMGSDCR